MIPKPTFALQSRLPDELLLSGPRPCVGASRPLLSGGPEGVRLQIMHFVHFRSPGSPPSTRPARSGWLRPASPHACQAVGMLLAHCGSLVDPRGVAPRTRPCHGRVLLLYHGPFVKIDYTNVSVLLQFPILSPRNACYNKKYYHLGSYIFYERSENLFNPVMHVLPSGERVF